MSQSVREPITGMRDSFGVQTRRRDFLGGQLADMARLRGYERLAVPLLERASSFDERVVGQSPWPEWNPAGVFGVQLVDYADHYETKVGIEDAVLVPEGTVPVARWLARRLSGGTPMALPVKVFYDLACYRNEPIDVLSETKLREFSQFGLEIMGAPTLGADAEALIFIHEALTGLGVEAGQIRIRVGNVGVFTALAEASSLPARSVIALKEHLDALAECRAGKQPDRAPSLHDGLAKLLRDQEVPAAQRRAWQALAEHDTGLIDGEIAARLRAAIGSVADDRLEALTAVAEVLATGGITGVVIDLGVVRSHEYYTDMAFEVDVQPKNGDAHVEIAGGGRYDRLIGHFLPEGGPTAVPSTGFAFGVERVVEVLAEIGAFDQAVTRTSTAFLAKASADTLVMPGGRMGTDAEAEARSYLAAHDRATELRRSGTRADVWVGGPGDDPAAYASARGIEETIAC